MTAPTRHIPGGSASNMAESLAQLKGVPAKQKQEACVEGMEHTASVKKRTAQRMQGRKVAIVERTAEGMGTAVNQDATRHAFEGRLSAPNTVRTGSAQRTGARPTHTKERRSVLSIPLTK